MSQKAVNYYRKLQLLIHILIMKIAFYAHFTSSFMEQSLEEPINTQVFPLHREIQKVLVRF